jgi:hypothetical protein
MLNGWQHIRTRFHGLGLINLVALFWDFMQRTAALKPQRSAYLIPERQKSEITHIYTHSRRVAIEGLWG